MEKKKIIMTLCKEFPANHPLAGTPTGFEAKLKDGTKIHTIRSNAKGAWEKRCAEIASSKKYLCIREWTGRPYFSEQRDLARVDEIGLQQVTMAYDSYDDASQVWVDGKRVPIEDIAKNNGLALDDFISWYFKDTNVFEGVIIHFTKFRY